MEKLTANQIIRQKNKYLTKMTNNQIYRQNERKID